jgi:hypothetical protein
MNVVRKSLDCDDRWCGRMLTLTAATEADAPLSRATFALPCTAYLSLGVCDAMGSGDVCGCVIKVFEIARWGRAGDGAVVGRHG